MWFEDRNVDVLGDMHLLPHLDSVKTMVFSFGVFREAVAGNYFGSEVTPEDWLFTFIVVYSRQGICILFVHCHALVLRNSPTEVLKGLRMVETVQQYGATWFMFYGSNTTCDPVALLPLEIALDPVCELLFPHGCGHVVSLHLWQLIVTTEPEGSVMLPRIITKEGDMSFVEVLKWEHLARSTEQDLLHPRSGNPWLSLHTGPPAFLGEHLGDPDTPDDGRKEDKPAAAPSSTGGGEEMDYDSSEGPWDPSPIVSTSMGNSGGEVEESPEGASAVAPTPAPHPTGLRPLGAIHLRYGNINESLLDFNDTRLNSLMKEYASREWLIENTSAKLVCERAEELGQVFKLHGTLKQIANIHMNNREAVVDGFLMARALNQQTRMKLWMVAWEAYENTLAIVDKEFRQKCDLDTKLHNSEMLCASTTAHMDLMEALKDAHSKILEVWRDLNDKVHMEESVIDKMVHEFNCAAVELHDKDSTESDETEAWWLACASQAINATLSLRGKPNPLPSIDSLLAAHSLAFQLIAAAMKGDTVQIPLSPTSLHDTDVVGALPNQFWCLIQEYQEQYCNEATVERRNRQYKDLETKPTTEEQKNKKVIVDAMMLAEEQVALDADTAIVLAAHHRAYYNYSFVDPLWFPHSESIRLCCLFKASTLPKTFIEAPAYLSCANLPQRGFQTDDPQGSAHYTEGWFSSRWCP